MACLSQEELFRLASDEVGHKDAMTMREHVSGCASCQRELEEIRWFNSTLKRYAPETSGQDDVPGDCLDSMALATYRSGNLSDTERERAEAHLARCDYCLHEIIDAVARSKQPLLKDPTPSLQAAIGTEPLKKTSLADQVRQWFESLGSFRLTFAGAAACAVVMLAVYLAHYKPTDRSPETEISLVKKHDPNSTHSPEELRGEFKVKLTDELKQALVDYDPKSNSASQGGLLSLLRRNGLPASAEIKNVEIQDVLVIAIKASNEPLEAMAKLYKDGSLMIGIDANK